ncbi:hypothetical protein KM043_014966 [Ampulex compressa]|nr:hypothetical protein KM043_014966 [Ampulex compressa]
MSRGHAGQVNAEQDDQRTVIRPLMRVGLGCRSGTKKNKDSLVYHSPSHPDYGLLVAYLEFVSSAPQHPPVLGNLNIEVASLNIEGRGWCKGLRVMETQDVNEAGGLAFLAASKTPKDFSLVTSEFWPFRSS